MYSRRSGLCKFIRTNVFHPQMVSIASKQYITRFKFCQYVKPFLSVKEFRLIRPLRMLYLTEKAVWLFILKPFLPISFQPSFDLHKVWFKNHTRLSNRCLSNMLRHELHIPSRLKTVKWHRGIIFDVRKFNTEAIAAHTHAVVT